MKALREGLLNAVRLCLAVKLATIGYCLMVVCVALAIACPVSAVQQGEPAFWLGALVFAVGAVLSWKLIKFAFSLLD